MRKRPVAAGVAAVVLGVAVTTAASAPAQTRYYEFAIDVSFYSQTDYGNEPQSVWIDYYRYRAAFELRAVTVFENKALRPGPNVKVPAPTYARWANPPRWDAPTLNTTAPTIRTASSTPAMLRFESASLRSPRIGSPTG